MSGVRCQNIKAKAPGEKIKSVKEIKKIIDELRCQGKKTAFTNGCFDILHYGHVQYLSKAKQKADILVVGLNSDSSVRRLKGRRRPVNKQLDRARLLSALGCVDFIAIFNEDTPLQLIKFLKPDVLIKGGDWKSEEIVGADFVKGYGGRVLTIPYLKGYSTSKLIERASCSLGLAPH